MTNSYFYYLKWLSILLLVKAVFMAGVILLGAIGLGPDEAQYWTWSQQLDWGYYSKPPGIAWQIWWGTEIFGNNEFGVRFVSLIFSFIQAILVFLVAAHTGLKPKTCFWSGLMMALTPLGILGSMMAITDGGMLLFWTLAALNMVMALPKKEAPQPFLMGLCLFGGALFKWPIYFFWIFYLICWRLYFPQQKITQILVGVLISLAGLLPSLWWNATHEWATFRHVFSTVQGGNGATGGNFLSFVGSQAALVSPLLFVILCLSFVTWIRQWKTLSPPLFFCGLVCNVCLGVGVTLSVFQKIQGNWVIYAYPTAFVVMGWKVEQWKKEIWVGLALIFSVFLTAIVLIAPLPQKMNPFKHNQGWQELTAALQKIGYDPKSNFLVSDKYQTTSLLSFYSPGQKRAYFLNLGGARKNQFSYWPGLEVEAGDRSGYFVWIENAPYLQKELESRKEYYLNALHHSFKQVQFVGFEPLQVLDDQTVKGALFFKCSGLYDLPKETSLW